MSYFSYYSSKLSSFFFRD